MKLRLLFLLLLLSPAAAQDDAPPPVAVSFTLDATEAKSGAVKVEMLIQNNRDEEVTLGLPVWEPGRYRIVDFFKGVKDLEAEIAGKKAEVEPTDHKSLWKVKTKGVSSFKVRYSLKPSDVEELKGQLTADHFDLLGPASWLYVKDRMNGPHQVTFKLPEGWKAASGLEKLSDSAYGARDYDTFADCPIELGKFVQYDFDLDGVRYELVVHSDEEIDAKKLVEIHRKFIPEQTRIFGGAPFERYVFLYHFSKTMSGGSGLEHLNSTRIHFNLAPIKNDPAAIASIASHEFFHLWNVKRIRPKELGPFDYSQKVRSKALWLSEGVTSYYGDLTLARAGVWTRETYLGHLAGEITQLQNNPTRKTQSVEEASRTVFDRPYRRGAVAFVDYYNKGELLGWLIDFKIRQITKGERSLDDVMRHLYRTLVVEPSKAGKGAIGVGFEEDGILKAVNEVSGADFKEFFTKYVAGTDELPYEEILKPAGLTVTREKTLGLFIRNLEIRGEPRKDSAAAAAGVKRQDKIVKVNGKPVEKDADLAKALDLFNLGDKVTLHLTRAGADQPIRVELPIVAGSYGVRDAPNATDAQKSLVKTWLAPSK